MQENSLIVCHCFGFRLTASKCRIILDNHLSFEFICKEPQGNKLVCNKFIIVHMIINVCKVSAVQ